MTLHIPNSRPLACLKSALRIARSHKLQIRSVSAGTLAYRAPPPEPPRNDPWAPIESKPRRRIKCFQNNAWPGLRATSCSEPVKTFNASQIALLDPSGSRTRLFAKDNEDRVNMGDVLLVRFKNGDPFYGVCMSLRRRGPDTGILLRNTVLRVATEMWVKIYNPTVVGIEIVQRALRRARRGRLTYLRKPEHDRGDLSGVLNEYSKTRRTLNAKRQEAKKREKNRLRKLAQEEELAQMEQSTEGKKPVSAKLREVAPSST